MQEVATVHDFLVQRALPLWSSAGFDAAIGSFVERLAMDGAPDFAAPKRLRVQARQIYVFAHAALSGLWPDGTKLALDAFGFIDRHARAGDTGEGFVHSLTRDGAPADRRCDSYDHAFLLFAFAWLYRATGEVRVRTAMEEVTLVIQTRLALPDAGVAVDTSDATERQQNPNMHLFEAYLAAANATGDSRYLALADQQERLFTDRLFAPREAVLREFYAADWSPAPGARGDIVEPGHHCEWVWLLKRHADAHRRPVSDAALALYDFAERFGRPDGRILLCDQLSVDGTPQKLSTRLWPQTEAVKAEIAMAEISGSSRSDRIDAIVRTIFDRFLDQPVAGGWIDWWDEGGSPLVSTIPASSLYHLFLAFSEYLELPSNQ